MLGLKGKKQQKTNEPQGAFVSTPEGKKHVKFFSKSVHLQAYIRYKLPDGQVVGAMLLNKGTASKPLFKLRFGWDTDGFPHVSSAEQAEAIATSVSAIAEEILSGQKLRFCFESFGNDLPFQEEYLGHLEKCPETLIPFVGEDLKINQDIHESGECRPKNLYLWGDYSDSDAYELDATEQVISRLLGFKDRLSGADKDIEQQSIDRFLIKGYEHGYLPWSSLFKQKLSTEVICMTPERIRDLGRATLNRFGDRSQPPRKAEPLPQVIIVDLQKGIISEEVNTPEAPVRTFLDRLQSIPAPSRPYVKVDGKYVGGFYLENHPKSIEASGDSTAAQNALSYLWKWFARSSSKNMEVIVEINLPSQKEVNLTSARNIKQSKARKKEKDSRGIVSERDDAQLQQALQAERDLENKTVVEFAFAAFLYCDTESQLSASADDFQRYFNTPAKLVREVDYVFELWTSSRLYSAKSILLDIAGFRDRRDRTTADFIPTVLPILNTHSPHKTGLQFIDLKGGSPFRFDPFKHLGHTAIYGETGSGKTLLLIDLIYQARLRLMPVVGLDFTPTGKASSYEDFVNSNDGVYFDVLRHELNILETPEVAWGSSQERIDDATSATRDFQGNILTTIVLGADQKSTEYDALEIRALIGLVLERFWSDSSVLDQHRLAREGGIESNAWQQYPVLYKERDVCLTRFCTVSHLNISSPTTKQRDALNFIRERLESFAVSPHGQKLNAPSTFSLQNDLLILAMRGKLNNDLAAVYGSLMFFLAYRKAVEASENLGSVTVVDESNIIFDNASIATQAGVTTSSGRKAGMRMFICAQTPATILSSAGGSSFKANITYNLVGKVNSRDLASYTSKDYLNLPPELIQLNTSFPKPTREKGFSQWFVDIDGVMNHGRLYLPPSLLFQGSNNIEEIRERRKAQPDNSLLTEHEELLHAS
jgi:hypothetical protein